MYGHLSGFLMPNYPLETQLCQLVGAVLNEKGDIVSGLKINTFPFDWANIENFFINTYHYITILNVNLQLC